ncbi:MAG TPA: ComEC/Rec2 family competence protein [Azospirillaceae bacterium]|nr:ComEC/Rec2 family competence protein [Azospirillaceae bacterium]
MSGPALDEALDAGDADWDGPSRHGLAARMAAPFLAERDRWALWAPVALGLGISAYFALEREPPALLGPFLSALAGCLLLAVRERAAAPLAAALLVAGLGFSAAQLRTALVAAPMLADEIGPVRVEGRVVQLDRLEEGLRVVLADPRIERLPPSRTPARVRVRLHEGDEPPRPGDRLRLLAVLDAPSEPVEPGAFDFRRHAWFLGIGGVGFALGPAERLPRPPEPPTTADRLEGLRDAIAVRVAARLEGSAAAVTTALLNGEQTAIPESDLEAMRQSGLQHLLSISGLHVGLVAGLVFFAVRALLALWEGVALRRPIKKWAALAALLATIAYTMLVGAPVPTLRSALMTGVVLLAVMVDRSALNMRVIALAATIVLLLHPEALSGPSFQMSFAAVLCLIATYEALAPRLAEWNSGAGWAGRAGLYVLGLSLTSVVATIATLPFSLNHFQQVANYGLLANLVAVPITSFLVMPCGVLAYLLMPLGLEGWALEGMGLGARAILWTAHQVADLPGATLTVPAMHPGAFIAVIAGGLWLALWRRRWRWWGAVPVVLGLALGFLAPRPDLLVSASGSLVGVRDADGRLVVTSARSGRFEAENWHRRDGVPGRPAAWPRDTGGVLSCDRQACIHRPPSWPGAQVAIVLERDALAEECAAADLVITRVAGPCGAPLVIGPRDLRDRGAHALWLSHDGVRVETVRPGRGARPWN